MSDTTATTNTTPNDPWYASFADADLRGRAELSKFESPEKLMASYVNLEKHIGVPPDRLLKLPETPDSAEWAAIKARIPGLEVPEDATGYELNVPEGFSPDYAKAVAEFAKGKSIPKSVLQELASFNNDFVKTALAAEEKSQEQAHAAALAELRVEWGGNYDTSMALSQRAEAAIKSELGVGDETLLAWQNADPKAYHKLLAYQASRLAEAPRIDGKTPEMTSSMSPEAAQTRLKDLMDDRAWFERWNAGDQEARKLWSDLNAVIARGRGG